MSALLIDRIRVGECTVDAFVSVDSRFVRTSVTPALAPTVRELLPGLARHSCENDRSVSAIEELADTETAHLFEHVALELMALAGSPRTLKGRTTWDRSQFGPFGYKVSVEYDHDLVAIAALNEAALITDWLMTGEGSHPDVDALAALLHALRSQAD